MEKRSDIEKLLEIAKKLSSEIKRDRDAKNSKQSQSVLNFDENLFKRPIKEDGSFDDYPGSEEFWNEALKLDLEERLHITIEVESAAISKAERMFGDDVCYNLVFDPFNDKVTYRVPNTPKQNYLLGNGWPTMLELPRKRWPDLKPKWETLEVYQFNLREAFETNDFERKLRQNLCSLAERILKPVFTH